MRPCFLVRYKTEQNHRWSNKRESKLVTSLLLISDVVVVGQTASWFINGIVTNSPASTWLSCKCSSLFGTAASLLPVEIGSWTELTPSLLSLTVPLSTWLNPPPLMCLNCNVLSSMGIWLVFVTLIDRRVTNFWSTLEFTKVVIGCWYLTSLLVVFETGPIDNPDVEKFLTLDKSLSGTVFFDKEPTVCFFTLFICIISLSLAAWSKVNGPEPPKRICSTTAEKN